MISSNNWIYYENKRMDNKEKREAKKQMERDVQETLLDRNIQDWENYCGACDNFPGDEFHEPSSFILHIGHIIPVTPGSDGDEVSMSVTPI